MPVTADKSALNNEGAIMGLGQKETRADKSAKAGEAKGTASTMTDAEKKMTVEEWKTVFLRYEKDIDFVKKGLDKGRFEDAIKDLDELLANIVYDTKLSGHAVVVAFFKINVELTHLHREIKVAGYAATEQFWYRCLRFVTAALITYAAGGLVSIKVSLCAYLAPRAKFASFVARLQPILSSIISSSF